RLRGAVLRTTTCTEKRRDGNRDQDRNNQYDHHQLNQRETVFLIAAPRDKAPGEAHVLAFRHPWAEHLRPPPGLISALTHGDLSHGHHDNAVRAHASGPRGIPWVHTTTVSCVRRWCYQLAPRPDHAASPAAGQATLPK